MLYDNFLKKFFKKISKLSLYNLGVMAIYLFSQPALRKIYSPEEYGKYDLILKLSLIFSALYSLKLEKLIPSDKNKKNVTGNIIGIILINFVLTILLLIALIPVINTEIYYSLIFAATIGLFFSINQTLKLRVIDIGDINSFGLANLLKKIIEIISNLTVSRFGLIFGEYTGLLSSFSVLCKEKIKISFKKSLDHFKENKSIIVINLLPELLLNLSNFLLVFIVIYNFDLSVAGIFEMADKFIFIPLVLLSNPIGNVILDLFSKINDNKNLINKLYKVVAVVFTLSFLITILIYFFSGFIINLFFEDIWADSIKIIKILCPFLFLRVAIAPFNQILLAKRDLFGYNFTQIIRLFSVSILFLFSFSDIFLLAAAISIAQSIAYILMFVFIFKRVKKISYSNE